MSILIDHVSFSYGDHEVFSDFSMEIAEGQTICIMGASGCGKTTLLKLLTESLKPDQGIIQKKENTRIAMVFQEDRLCEMFSALANVRIGCERGMFLLQEKGKGDELIREHLKEVGLEEVCEKKVSLLSGGMKRRVAIVRAILSDSDVVILDEPLKGLDENTKQTVISYIKKHKGSRTLIIVTHDADEVTQFDGIRFQLMSTPKNEDIGIR